MPVQELVVGLKDDVWEVRVGGYLLAAEPTQMAALTVARKIADGAVVHGVRSEIAVIDLDGHRTPVPDDCAAPIGGEPAR